MVSQTILIILGAKARIWPQAAATNVRKLKAGLSLEEFQEPI